MNSRTLFAVLVVAMALPSVVTWIYFVWLDGAPVALQQSAYAVGKLVQFALPVIVCFALLREPWPRLAWTTRGMALGTLFGLFVVAAMFGLYFGLLDSSEFFETPRAAIREKIVGIGVGSMPAFIGLGVFYSLIHSGLEEYYWRWFVYRKLREPSGVGRAMALSSVAFAAHHVLLLTHFFGSTSVLAYLLAAAVGIGGFAWAWLYERSQSLLAPWLSHMVVDAGIFSLGYYLARDLLHA